MRLLADPAIAPLITAEVLTPAHAAHYVPLGLLVIFAAVVLVAAHRERGRR